MKPEKMQLQKVGDALSGTYDLFICSSSFEDRCRSIASHINTDQVKRACIVSNTDLLDYISDNKKFLEHLFGERSHTVEISTSKPLLTGDKLMVAISDALAASSVNRILLDVTTFTHESLLILIWLLRLYCHSSSITVVYASAAEYSVGDDVEYKWLSRGIGEIRSVLGYPGNVSPSRKTHLIIVVGYEHERAAGLIQALEPHSIALGYARSGTATTEKDQSANERYMELVKQMATSYSQFGTFEVPCDDPEGTCDEIDRQIKLANGMNVLIAPMNNKLSTIGVAHAALKNVDVQLCYAQALLYNYTAYSKPGNQCYVFEMTL